MENNMLSYLEKTAARVPTRIAFFDDAQSLTYSILEEAARRIGSALAMAVKPRSFIALLLDARSLDNIPAMFGVLYAGCAYAPLDITMPKDRLHLLLDLLAPGAIIADEKGMKALGSCGYEKPPVLSYNEAAIASQNGEVLARIREQCSVYDPMSVLYTSGSTGIPKGSIQNHFSYIHWMKATIEIYNLNESMIFGNQSPFFYANSIIDIFPAVALGAAAYLLPPGVLTFPKKMIECLAANHVTDLCMTPSSYIAVAKGDVLTAGCLPHLKRGYMSGEPMPWQPLNAWMQATPNAEWWHFYGSTEMYSVAVGKVDKNHREEERLPVGRPFPLAHILFINEEGEEAAPGEPGEMLVSSPWIARGYHRDEARSRAAWVTDPLDRGWHERFYRSGDIGYFREDGQLMVLGRRDTQIKHMGYRMELGEVEAALRAIPGFVDGYVFHHKERDRLWCFFTGTVTEKEIRQNLKERLSRYMIPDVFMHLDELPHTASMKIDRARLVAIMKQGE